ncbi:hypothetical protein E4K67_05295 [Desulfosporosinus fructosivorans]|uniref:Uncharacterized protein n=1 Tax=Desulfosporosinus fructosivorans TaxID=2018669 RepID=A0A4Z0R6W8_9FIRM|nr:hypothetical protein [Desulfosporosinus fructosivorans]TGE38891.1 hypothetical protein E4K67_05295 [Desulfosporosinus fructosivorans]
MKEIEKKLLGIYDLFLASGAIYIGVKMVNSNNNNMIKQLFSVSRKMRLINLQSSSDSGLP